VKKNVQIFLVIVGVVCGDTPSFKSKQTIPATGSTDGHG